MRKNKKIYTILLFIAISIYVVIILINQQKTIDQYSLAKKDIQSQLSDQTDYNKELNNTKNNVNSKEFIENMAREKLDMYMPNEKVYIDKGM